MLMAKLKMTIISLKGGDIEHVPHDWCVCVCLLIMLLIHTGSGCDHADKFQGARDDADDDGDGESHGDK